MKKLNILIMICLVLALATGAYAGATKIKDDMRYMGEVTVDGVIQEKTNETDGTSLCFEGSTNDAYETCLLFTDPTADRVVTFGDSSYTAGATNAHTADVTITGTTPMLTIGDTGDEDINLRFDGNTTEGNFQLCVDATDDDLHIGSGILTDPCGTNTALQITDASPPAITVTGVTTFNGNVTVGSGVTDDITITSAILGASPFILDGTTDDTNELTIAVSPDPAADKTLTLPSTTNASAMISALTTNDVDVANSVWGVSNGLAFGGTTGADTFEVTVSPGADPGADVALTLPVASGAITTAIGAGSYRTVESITATNIQTVADCGKTLILNHATVSIVVTLPAPTSGCYFKIAVGLAFAADHTVATNADANVLMGGINELEVDTNDDGPYNAAGDLITFVNSVESVGDYVEFISDGTKWYINGISNLDGGITIGST